MNITQNLILAFRYYYKTDHYYYTWLLQPSLDIAHYGCNSCYNIQNSTHACIRCGYDYPDMMLCNGKDGHENCNGCVQIIMNKFSYIIDDMHYFSTKIQKNIRGYITRQELKHLELNKN